MTYHLSRFWRQHGALLVLLILGCCVAHGCAKPAPEPTTTKEERRLQEKEIMRREMRNE